MGLSSSRGAPPGLAPGFIAEPLLFFGVEGVISGLHNKGPRGLSKKLILAWAVGAVLAGAVAFSRGRNPAGWFIIALVASPLLALIAPVAMPTREMVPTMEEAAKDAEIYCPQ
jgi:hypothetical protein